MSYKLVNGLNIWEDEETVFAISEIGKEIPALIKESGTWISSNGIDFDCLVIPSEKYEAERAEQQRIEENRKSEIEKIPSLEQRVADAESALLFLMEVTNV